MHYLINAWLEKGGIFLNYAPWYGLTVYQRGSDGVKLYMVKMGKDIDSICMEGQGHIAFCINVQCRGVLCSVNGILFYFVEENIRI